MTDRPALPSRRLLLAGAVTAAALARPALAATADKVIDLWPGEAPGGQGVTATENIAEAHVHPTLQTRVITGVRVPQLTLSYPQVSNGAAMLILPGGGFHFLSWDAEGTEIAAWLTRLGFTTGLLKYRLPSDGWKAGIDVAVQDGQRAMRLLRQEMHGGKVGAIGFSAGGYLTAALATRFSERLDGQVDPADGQSARPDFAAIIYGAFGNEKQNIPELSGKVTAQTPPVFMAHAADDPKAPAINTVMASAKLLALKVPVEMHLFETGDHGFALRTGPADRWPALFDTWSKTHLKA
jgi:acetyl esterase/lipase